MRRRLLSAVPMLVAALVVVGLALALEACGAGGAKEEAKARPRERGHLGVWGASGATGYRVEIP